MTKSMKHFWLCLFCLLLSGAVALGTTAAATAQPQYDVIIKNGNVLDGTGNSAYQADVAIKGDRIAEVGDLSEANAERVINAEGRYVAPGFIDRHTHTGDGLDEGLATPELSAAEPQIAQGITTVGVNPDGGGQADLVEQREALLEDGLGVNVMQMVPHGPIREEVMGEADRAPTPEEMEQMKQLVREGMEAGGFGLSSGTFYTPGIYAENEELVELSKEIAPYGGVYTSHIRDEADYNIGFVAAVDEVIEVAREAQVPGVVTHIKARGRAVWGESSTVIDNIERARAQGVEIWADQYPYDAAQTSLTGYLVPRDAQEGGEEELLSRLEDDAEREQIRDGMLENIDRLGGAERLQISAYEEDPSLEGKTIQQVADERDLEPVDAALELVEGDPSIVAFAIMEEDIRAFMQQPWTMTSSDGGLVEMGEEQPHSRYYGTFPRKISKYVVEDKVVDLPRAIHSMTGQPASVFGMSDRGLIREGNYADITVFDLDRVQDKATFEDPHQLSEGMDYVMVNGQFAREDGEFNDELNGRVLEKQAEDQQEAPVVALPDTGGISPMALFFAGAALILGPMVSFLTLRRFKSR